MVLIMLTLGAAFPKHLLKRGRSGRERTTVRFEQMFGERSPTTCCSNRDRENNESRSSPREEKHRDMGTMREWNFAKMISGGKLVTSEMDHFEDLEVLSKIGASGDQVGNCLRDLEKHPPPSSIAMPEPIQIPMKIKTGDPPVFEDVN